MRRFLGEGGKKKVYLAHDERLDRDVAVALIKTDGLDDVGRERITREAQAMGRLGAHPELALENAALQQQLAMYEHRRRPQISKAGNALLEHYGSCVAPVVPLGSCLP